MLNSTLPLSFTDEKREQEHRQSLCLLFPTPKETSKVRSQRGGFDHRGG